MTNDNPIKEKSKEDILRKHYEAFTAAHPEVKWQDWDKDNDSQEIGFRAMEEYAEIRTVAFAEWLQENRWFNFERNEGLWYYTFEQGTAMSDKTYNKNYRKTTSELYALFIKKTENLTT